MRSRWVVGSTGTYGPKAHQVVINVQSPRMVLSVQQAKALASALYATVKEIERKQAK